MTLPANIRVNVRAPFPTQVQSAGPFSISKANGIWTLAPNYENLALSGNFTATQRLALQDSVSGLWSYVPAAFLGSPSIAAPRTVTATGAVSSLSTDISILFKKSSSGASVYDLPVSSSRNGAPIILKDMTGDANANNITAVPATGETIDGLSGSAAAANGLAVIDRDYGSLTLYPLPSGGWYTL